MVDEASFNNLVFAFPCHSLLCFWLSLSLSFNPFAFTSLFIYMCKKKNVPSKRLPSHHKCPSSSDVCGDTWRVVKTLRLKLQKTAFTTLFTQKITDHTPHLGSVGSALYVIHCVPSKHNTNCLSVGYQLRADIFLKFSQGVLAP